MEFVGNKKTACFCDSGNCSGLIGEKPKDPEKKMAQIKKKPKQKPSTLKIVQPEAKKRRTLDPFESLLEQMPNKVAESLIKPSPSSSSDQAETNASDEASSPSSVDQDGTTEPMDTEEPSLTEVIESVQEMPANENIILPSFKHVTGDAPDFNEPQTDEIEANLAEIPT